MSGHGAIKAMLGAPGVVALVGQRVYFDVMADNSLLPALTIQKLGGDSARGAQKNPGLDSAQFQVSTWAKSRVETVIISSQVRKAIDRVRELVIDGTLVNDCFYEGDVDLYDSETKIFFNQMTFNIHYRDPV
ncbi:hypothetical protein BA896_012710 [Janthinobacterium lividum]|uniref:DUF3168 domain-containing protein n=1 Tax=Janthinobacterium lividum TaxID=29581 RepID=A0A1E8PVE3_9BURK|nr:hypothetical protein BA896_012710 [Janthinobacterium lividum]